MPLRFRTFFYSLAFLLLPSLSVADQSSSCCFSAPPTFLSQFHFYLNFTIPVASSGDKITLTFPKDYSIESILTSDGSSLSPLDANSPCPPQPHTQNTFSCSPKSIQRGYFKVNFKLYTPTNPNQNPNVTLSLASTKCDRNDNYCPTINGDNEADDGKVNLGFLGVVPREVAIVAGILVGLLSIGFFYLLIKRQMFLCGYSPQASAENRDLNPDDKNDLEPGLEESSSSDDSENSIQNVTNNKNSQRSKSKTNEAAPLKTGCKPKENRVHQQNPAQLPPVAPKAVKGDPLPLSPEKLSTTLNYVYHQSNDGWQQRIHSYASEDNIPLQEKFNPSVSIIDEYAKRCSIDSDIPLDQYCKRNSGHSRLHIDTKVSKINSMNESSSDSDTVASTLTPGDLTPLERRKLEYEKELDDLPLQTQKDILIQANKENALKYARTAQQC